MTEGRTIHRAILRTLSRTQGVLLPLETLVEESRLLAPGTTVTEARTAIERLEAERAVVSGRLALSDGLGYRVTALGLTLLNE